jgi:hypothetical protein
LIDIGPRLGRVVVDGCDDVAGEQARLGRWAEFLNLRQLEPALGLLRGNPEERPVVRAGGERQL